MVGARAPGPCIDAYTWVGVPPADVLGESPEVVPPTAVVLAVLLLFATDSEDKGCNHLRSLGYKYIFIYVSNQ